MPIPMPSAIRVVIVGRQCARLLHGSSALALSSVAEGDGRSFSAARGVGRGILGSLAIP